MKQLAGDDTTSTTNGYDINNLNIRSVKKSETEPINSNKEEKNVVSTSDSEYPIYMWFDNGTIYWWSEDKTPFLNEDASYMFSSAANLIDISGVSSFDITKTQRLFLTFCSSDLRNLDALKKWDVSNVTNMQSLFAENKLLENINGIENWDVSNAKNLSYLLENCYNLEEINLSKWYTKSVTNLNNMFAMWNDNNGPYTNGKLKRIILSEKFDTSNVDKMYGLFANNTKIENYDFLKYIDTSNVKNAGHMFLNNHNLKNLDSLKDWDTSNMQNIFQMFALCKGLEDISAIKNWNVGKVTNFSGLFYENNKINDASPLNDWNISSGEEFINMFYNVPSHPEFSMISGRWNHGTFIPN
jgi:surface protein